MDDLRDTLMAYGCIAIRAGDFNGLNDFLEQECGTRLHVAWPERCFIQLRSRSALGPFVGKMGTVCSQGKPHVVEDTWKEDVRSGTFFPGVFNVRGFFLSTRCLRLLSGVPAPLWLRRGSGFYALPTHRAHRAARRHLLLR